MTKTPSTHKFSVKKTLPAPPHEVWQAWTEPARISEWFQPDPQCKAKAASFEARAGGTFRIDLTGPETFALTGKVREAKPGEKLVYTWAAGREGVAGPAPVTAETVISVRFSAAGDATELSLEQDGFADAKAAEKHGLGWETCLTRLEALLSGKPLKAPKPAKPGPAAARAKASRPS